VRVIMVVVVIMIMIVTIIVMMKVIIIMIVIIMVIMIVTIIVMMKIIIIIIIMVIIIKIMESNSNDNYGASMTYGMCYKEKNSSSSRSSTRKEGRTELDSYRHPQFLRIHCSIVSNDIPNVVVGLHLCMHVFLCILCHPVSVCFQF
jgi:energy-coupling factor transporter transmembrane protein EcfT